MGKRAEKAMKAIAKANGDAETWRISDLPLHVQVELRAALDEARRGEGLQDFDEAIAEADQLVDEMFARLDSKKP